MVNPALFFSAWKTVIDGDALYKYLGTGQSLEAISFTNYDKLEMQIRDNTLIVNALQPHSWVLVFTEGRLVFPTLNQHDQGGRIPLEEGMEIKVLMFNIPPVLFLSLLQRVEDPMSVGDMTSLALPPENCSLLTSTITRKPHPIQIWRGYRAHRGSQELIFTEYFRRPLTQTMIAIIVISLLVGLVYLFWWSDRDLSNWTLNSSSPTPTYTPTNPLVPPIDIPTPAPSIPASPPTPINPYHHSWLRVCGVYGGIPGYRGKLPCLSFPNNGSNLSERILSCLGRQCNEYCFTIEGDSPLGKICD